MQPFCTSCGSLLSANAHFCDELEGHYAADAHAFGPYIQHILDMADMISGGIIEQFPSRFS